MKNKVEGVLERWHYFFFSIGTVLFLLQIIFRDINVITMIGFYYLFISIICNMFFEWRVLLIGTLA